MLPSTLFCRSLLPEGHSNAFGLVVPLTLALSLCIPFSDLAALFETLYNNCRRWQAFKRPKLRACANTVAPRHAAAVRVVQVVQMARERGRRRISSLARRVCSCSWSTGGDGTSYGTSTSISAQ